MGRVLIALIVVSVVALLALVAAGVLWLRLRRADRRYERLQQSLQPRDEVGVKHGAQKVLAVAVETASRLRHRGVTGLVMSSLDDLTRWAVEDRTEIVRIAADDGTVTFVFTDIENSTASNEELGDATWNRVLQAHDRVVRGRVAAHDGHIVKSQGDGFMIAFGDPSAAVAAAIDIERAITDRRRGGLRRNPVAVRIGMHRGTAVSRDGDWFGRNVAMAARVAAAATGGEVLVSDETWSALPPAHGFEFGPARTVELKGLSGEHVLRPVVWG